ncbi:MAG: ferredoxin:protochlorophyllide reductase (ATP-dependent) subunit B [Planktomarina sp.]|uniref:ferredoxin:protochlorophyllide reductase (ATP-dependent) subunit B n=1 Tax=uncultured Planktomarina sp. TaxID=1538529 RepID=UPI00288F2235|nr:ferredoxin:protochlorophyllide reductase (ATP-dependent) subunit B [Planktomarina sp.]MDT2069756.1 ferredoxin:protochlorophyllide reductase (ATP-dependent) subunit B [Planktomarina sp.]
MKLTVWTYEGPPHVGAMRVATGMKKLHYVLHAPQGDTYADLLFTMIERRDHRPPVTYTTFQARDLGADTAGLFKQACQDAYDRFQPEAIIVGASCTAELIQDDPGGLAETMGLPIPVIPLELPSYQRKENFGADETFFQLVKHLAKPQAKTDRVSCNIIGPTALGFRHRDDVAEITNLLFELGIEVNVTAPMGATPSDIAQMGKAHFNVLLYPETGETAARHCEKEFDQPYTKIVPIGAGATHDFITEVRALSGSTTPLDSQALRQTWWSRSVDSTYLTGKRVFIFGDGTHVKAAARIARDEMGFEVAGLGCYNREYARDIRTIAKEFGVEALITDDYLSVEKTIEALQPEMILGTQMERHIGKRLGIPCAVISAPVHVQDFPARYSPQMGFEGANVIFDTWIHPLVMGLEEHLLHMFREDFEFNDAAGPSHHGGHQPSGIASVQLQVPAVEEQPSVLNTGGDVAIWLAEAEKELKKIPFFVRGKARRNTETYATSQGLLEISVDTLYEAKAFYAR